MGGVSLSFNRVITNTLHHIFVCFGVFLVKMRLKAGFFYHSIYQTFILKMAARIPRSILSIMTIKRTLL